MKTIEVVAAIIREGDRVLATQRGYGEFEGMWEFPGGKIEPGEERVEALKREIGEELAVEIVVEELVCTVEYMMLTAGGNMHQPVFKGIREDKAAGEYVVISEN